MADRRILTLIGIVAIVALAGGGLWYGYARYRAQLPEAGTEKATLELLSEPMPVVPVTMRALDGRTLSSADWHGKVVILNFWATWCAPCRAEIPDLVALQRKYRDELQIIGISEDEEPPEVVRKFTDQYRVNYPIVMKTAEIEKAFPPIYALPTTFVIDRDTRVVQHHVGMLNAATTELETRVLAGLATNVSIEYVEDTTKKLIKNAAQATSIPGVELEKLSPAAKKAALQKLNSEKCTCGCALTLAACRINDPNCSISLPIARKIASEADSASP